MLSPADNLIDVSGATLLSKVMQDGANYVRSNKSHLV